MTTFTSKFTPLAYAALLAVAVPGASHAQTWGNIKAGVASAVTKVAETVPAVTPVTTVKQVQAWGAPSSVRDPALSDKDPMPFRGRPEQLADERNLDDRFVNRAKPASVQKPNRNVPEPSSVLRTAEQLEQAKTAQHHSLVRVLRPSEVNRPVNSATSRNVLTKDVCANVKATWEQAASLSRTSPDEAYSKYLELLTNCTDEKEQEGTAWQAFKNLPANLSDKLATEPVMAGGSQLPALYVLNSQKFFALNKQGKQSQALEAGRSIKEMFINKGDATALTVMGWLEHNVKNSKESQSLFRAALRIDKDNQSARQGLVTSYISTGKIAQAQAEATKLEDISVVEADLRIAEARQALKEGQADKAVLAVQAAEKAGAVVDESLLSLKAWALRGAGQTEKALPLFKSLTEQYPSNKEYANGYVETVADSNNQAELARLAAADGPNSARAKEALVAKLEAQGRKREAAAVLGQPLDKAAASLAGYMAAKSKSGKAGEDRLLTTVIPEGQITVPVNSNLTLRAAGANVKTDDGVLSHTGRELRVAAEGRIGDIEVVGGAGVSAVNGVNRLTVEAKARAYTDDGYLEGGLQREPVMDSAKSYGGKVMTLAPGKTGVVGQAMDAKLFAGGSHSVLDNQYKLGWRASMGSISGSNFESTGYIEARASITKDFKVPGYSWISAGPELRMSQYSSDQNRWTAGYGGFYSPKNEMGGGLKFAIMTQEGKKSIYKLSGFAGMMKKDFYNGSDSSILLEADAGAAFLLNDRMTAKVGAMLKSNSGYFDVGGYAGLELSWEPKKSLDGSDVSGFKVGR